MGQLFRVMVDIHEGTCEAAEGTVNILAKICVVSVSCDHGKNGMNISAAQYCHSCWNSVWFIQLLRSED